VLVLVALSGNVSVNSLNFAGDGNVVMLVVSFYSEGPISSSSSLRIMACKMIGCGDADSSTEEAGMAVGNLGEMGA